MNGKVKLQINVLKLPAAKEKEKIIFGKSNVFEQKYKEYNFKYGNIYNEIYGKYKEAKKKKIDGKTFFKTFDILTYIKKITYLAENENDEFFKQYLNLSKYEIYSFAGIYDADSILASQLLKSIPVTSPLWQINPRAFFLLTNACKQDTDYVYKFDEILKNAKSDNFKAEFSFWGIGNFIYKKDRKNEIKYYNYLITTFPETDWAKWAVMDFSPGRKIMVGKQIPAFSFKSLNDSTITVSDSTLKGKYYLIDLWATWCIPCVAEMKVLSELYEKYKSANFEIVSFSFDNKEEDALNFQRNDVKMPWLNVFVNGGSDSEFGQTFNTAGFPRHILIDTSGIIVKTEDELRIEDLEKVLEKYLLKADK